MCFAGLDGRLIEEGRDLVATNTLWAATPLTPGPFGGLSWTPEGFVGQMVATMKPYAPPPSPGAQPPTIPTSSPRSTATRPNWPHVTTVEPRP